MKYPRIFYAVTALVVLAAAPALLHRTSGAPPFSDALRDALHNASLEELLQQKSNEPTPIDVIPVAPLEGTVIGANYEGLGISHSGDPHDIPDFSPSEMAKLMKELGATHYRPHLPLNEAIKEITPAQMEELRLAQNDPARMNTLIDDLAKNGDWAKMDALVGAFVGQGIEMILVVGAAYVKECPLFTAENGTKQPISPDRVGRPLYLAMMRWLVGAGVRRYGNRVSSWQIENEINVAASVARFTHWRVEEASWLKGSFLRDLLQALGDAVHEEGRLSGREFRTVHNFLPGLPWAPWKHLAAGNKKSPKNSSSGGASQRDALDIVGIDYYSNYFLGGVPNGLSLNNHIRDAVSASDGRPVWVLETGFARGPKRRGFNEERQAKYFKKTFEEAHKAGASMVLAFGWFWNPNGWYTDREGSLPWWHPQAGEQYWSPLEVTREPDGSKQVRFAPAWDEFRKAAKR